ncbi:hypothetical protein PUN28_002873 [Cardiocondyla obscurior]|uniref:Uncharacterized protein n=1 Tax=Cardiocondyla obscurior TaxID=286306 RepID=A0AAW2GWE6_9HYME
MLITSPRSLVWLKRKSQITLHVNYPVINSPEFSVSPNRRHRRGIKGDDGQFRQIRQHNWDYKFFHKFKLFIFNSLRVIGNKVLFKNEFLTCK